MTGPVSPLGVALGVARVVPLAMVLGLTGGAIAVVDGVLGLTRWERGTRGRCLAGLTTGAVAFLVPTVALLVLTTSS
ncbi:hypothetical protein [Streptomyces sp. BBFR102]|uniref:hypothetical protein n=1 Tax=Streptomyces sp. BBFR102 TaxID=3448171 RepID=UPI003F53B937